MHAFEFQVRAMRTRNKGLTDDQTLQNAVMGLAGEAGECVDLLKKHLFQGHELNEDKLLDEVGDVLWYAALAAEALHVTLDDIMARNVEKLEERYPNGFDPDKSVHRKD